MGSRGGGRPRPAHPSEVGGGDMSQAAEVETRSEIRDGMRVEWHVPIPMDDGIVLRADVYRPVAEGRYPVVLTYGPYAKGLAFQEGYARQWQQLVREAPEVLGGSSSRYQSWETVDPEKWVPDGYVCVRVDSRGAGRPPGFLDVWSPREPGGQPAPRESTRTQT